MIPRVKILISIPDERQFESCTLVFKSIRIGFPTAPVDIYINKVGQEHVRERAEKLATAIPGDTTVTFMAMEVHHAVWIGQEVGYAAHFTPEIPLVILDGDTIFWKSVENWVFPPNVLLAGYYVPRIWNDFAKCVSLPRIHTSFMWFPKPGELQKTIWKAYPPAQDVVGEYCPCDPFMPATRFIGSEPFFWDSCCNLYQMLGHERTEAFSEAHKNAYDHLNSASFYNVMSKRLDDPRAFKFVHDFLVKNAPEDLRNLWPAVDAYYKQKEIEAQVRL